MGNYVWYASYGSNLLEERFLCYIRGGRPAGATKMYNGCEDKSHPTANKVVTIPYRLYFAQEATIWNGGGVAFIDKKKNPEEQTLARMYRITREQFFDVVKQENGLLSQLSIDLSEVMSKESTVLGNAGWYGLLLYLGEENREPVFTFTGEALFQPYTRPHETYLGAIIKGIKESHQLGDQEIYDYLVIKDGIKNLLESIILKALIRSIN